MKDGSYVGTFRFASGEEYPGQLTLAGRNTAVLAWSDKFSIYHGDYRSMTVELYDTRRFSLIDCQDQVLEEGELSFGGISMKLDDAAGQPAKQLYNVELDPQYVLFGDASLHADDEVISKLHISFSDLGALFFDPQVIGILGAKGQTGQRLLEVIRDAWQVRGDSIDDEMVGKSMAAVAFAVERASPFFQVDTSLGEVTGWHQVEPAGDANAQTLSNRTYVTITFSVPLTLEEAMHRASRLGQFFDLVAGRPQNIERLFVVGSELGTSWEMYVYPEYEQKSVRQAKDVLFDGREHGDELANVLSAWLDVDEVRQDVRSRFAVFSQGRDRFGVDRLVNLANMLDSLPAEYPSTSGDAQLEEALTLTQQVFEDTAPEYAGRAMGALGVLKGLSLDDKIRHRTELINRQVGDLLPHIDQVVQKAKQTRNVLVHSGTQSRAVDRDAAKFFASTLEFVFAASELVEAGWNIRRWADTGLPSSHPFARFLGIYKDQLRRFKIVDEDAQL